MSKIGKDIIGFNYKEYSKTKSQLLELERKYKKLDDEFFEIIRVLHRELFDEDMTKRHGEAVNTFRCYSLSIYPKVKELEIQKTFYTHWTSLDKAKKKLQHLGLDHKIIPQRRTTRIVVKIPWGVVKALIKGSEIV